MGKPVELTLKEGDKAPDFTAPVSDGRTVTLSEFKGKPVVLYFYPKDSTPGCTKEACGFRDAHESLRKAGAVVLGVSVDSLKSHQKFIDKFQLPFLLISDDQKQIVQAYGVWGEKRFMGRKYMGIHRVTFLIGGDGRVKKIWSAVKPETHADEVLTAVQSL